MRRLVVLAIACLLVVGLAPPAAAGNHAAEGGTHLALGDSVAAGTQQPMPFTDHGYTDLLFDKLQKKYKFAEFVNLACPGDDTVEMRFGIGGGSTYGSACYGPFAQLPPGGTSQLDAAVAYLMAHPGEVKLITLTMGANDILACDLNDPAVAACVQAQLGQIMSNLPVILGTLQAAAPGVPIVAMNYYNPYLALWITDPAGAAGSQFVIDALNATLHGIYGNEAFGVPVVDVAQAFKTYETKGKVPKNVKEICKLTLMCEKYDGAYVFSDYDPATPGPQTDIHPSDKGYEKIAKAFDKLIKKLKLFKD